MIPSRNNWQGHDFGSQVDTGAKEFRMGRRRTRSARSLHLITSVLLVFQMSCAALPPNSFLDPTRVGRFGLEPQETGIRRVLSPRETPPGLANATDPMPQDLVPVYDEYRIVPGDTLGISINDLITPGQPFSVVLQVSSLGEIRIPELNTIRVAGMTEQEIEEDLAARLREAGLLPRPVVIVTAQVRRGRVFTAMGAVGQSGQYPIPEPGTRLLDALGIIGDVAATSKKLYVIRPVQGVGVEPIPGPAATPPAPAVPPPPSEWVIPPPGEPAPAPALFATNVGRGGGVQAEPAPVPPPTGDKPAPQERTTQPTKQELAEVLEPGRAPAPPGGPAAKEKQPSQAPFDPIVFEPRGETSVPERRTIAEKPAEPAAPPAPEPAPRSMEEPFAWEDVGDVEFDQRVIAISVDELKGGNPRYNIVVRDRDVINVPTDTGVFYLMGEIARPGVYAFGGREITLKQAVATAGGLGQLAWPQRTEIIRHEPGTDKEIVITVNLDAIFAGLEEDLYLRDDDIVNVGTHFVAPFLFVIRNSFRFTYGFGFVYDRNFADKDAYGARINPDIIEQQRRQTRGLPF